MSHVKGATGYGKVLKKLVDILKQVKTMLEQCKCNVGFIKNVSTPEKETTKLKCKVTYI